MIPKGSLSICSLITTYMLYRSMHYCLLFPILASSSLKCLSSCVRMRCTILELKGSLICFCFLILSYSHSSLFLDEYRTWVCYVNQTPSCGSIFLCRFLAPKFYVAQILRRRSCTGVRYLKDVEANTLPEPGGHIPVLDT